MGIVAGSIPMVICVLLDFLAGAEWPYYSESCERIVPYVKPIARTWASRLGYGMRQSGLPDMGVLPSGTHIVYFYRHARELMETHAAFCQAGLMKNEYCLWIMTPPCTEALAAFEFENLSMDVAPYRASGQLEFVSYPAWYFDAGAFSISRTVERSKLLMSQSQARGFAGVRICGTVSWLTTDREWNTFLTYEHAIHQAITGAAVLALCSYPIHTERESAFTELVHSHHAILRPSDQSWEYRPTTGLAPP